MPVHPRLMNLMLNQAGIPGRVRGTRLLDFKPTREQREVYAACCDFVTGLRDRYVSPTRPMDEYPENPAWIGVGLLLAGPAGTGKTTLAALTIQEIFLTYRLAAFFTTYADLTRGQIDLIRAEKNNDDEAWVELDLYVRKCYDIPVLALDDVGKERRTGSGFAEDELDRLLRHRYRNMKPTILTSNLKSGEWGTVYNPSMESFIEEAFDRYSVTGVDLRAEG